MAQEVSLLHLNDSIEPLCPRDSRVMRYDAKGFELPAESKAKAMPCYRCAIKVALCVTQWRTDTSRSLKRRMSRNLSRNRA